MQLVCFFNIQTAEARVKTRVVLIAILVSVLGTIPSICASTCTPDVPMSNPIPGQRLHATGSHWAESVGRDSITESESSPAVELAS